MKSRNARLRSANRGNANNAWYVNNTGNANTNNAANANRCAPDCVASCRHGCPIGAVERGGSRKEPNSPPRTGEQRLRDASGAQAPGATYAEDIIGFEALYESMRRCRCGVMWKASVASFCLNGLERVLELERGLKSGTYRARPVIHFRVTSPKPRDIASITFRDRVYQRSLNDNAVYPVIARTLIADNFACQKGKGTDAARERLKEFLRRYYRKHGARGWVAQFDIHGYYPNMPHALVEKIFRRHLAPEAFARALRVLREQYGGERGYNPGSQLVQIAGISALNGLDHYVKEQLRAKLYIRYMDDFLVVTEDEAFARRCLQDVTARIEALGFEVNPEKTRVFPLEEGIEFLGFRFRLTETGKVLMLICPRNVKAARKRLARIASLVRKGRMTRKQADDSYAAWRSHAAKGGSWRLLRNMDAFYTSLWRA